MGQRGGQLGNRNAAHDKPWTRALERYAAQNPDKLAQLAEKTFSAALDGDMAATREIADRLDGKAKQVIDARVERAGDGYEYLSDEELHARISELQLKLSATRTS
jgi:hypothetical protein